MLAQNSMIKNKHNLKIWEISSASIALMLAQNSMIKNKQEEIQECKFWESKNIMNNGDCEDNNMQYYGHCDRDDCKFVHQKNSNRKQRKSTKHKNYSSNYNSYNNNYNNHLDQDWYNNDFFKIKLIFYKKNS